MDETRGDKKICGLFNKFLQGKLGHRGKGEKRGERRQIRPKSCGPFDPVTEYTSPLRTSAATLTPVWTNTEVLRKGGKMIRFQMMGEMTITVTVG